MARILIVDDEEMDRVFEASILTDAGHEVFFAPHGEAALKLFKAHTIDLVITDLAMPEMNGLRLIRELLSRDPDARIVAISGVAADQLDLAQDYGAVRTLFKPVAPADLLKTVGEALAHGPGWQDPWGRTSRPF